MFEIEIQYVLEVVSNSSDSEINIITAVFAR